MTKPASRQRLDPSARRAQLLEVACELFIERGYEAVDMAAIAEHAGISRPTVYNYFPSTEAMLGLLLDSALEEVWPRLRPLVGQVPGEPDPEHLRGIFLLLLREHKLLALLHSGGGPGFQRRRYAMFSERLAKQLDAALAWDCPPYLMLSVSVLLENMAYWALTDPAIDVEALANTLTAFVTFGIGGIKLGKPLSP